METNKRIEKLTKEHDRLLSQLAAAGLIVEDITPYGSLEEHLEQQIKYLRQLVGEFVKMPSLLDMSNQGS